jgi:hypothetical protein
MSCFQFTKKQCKKISGVSSNFWWGTKDGQRKVYWISWDKMCRSKDRGGLDFCDFECFNKAFLAKQGWRMITEPNSLCTRVLKVRYYKEGDFLSASCPKRASYTWRSIVYGQDLLREGLVWWVGGGDQIKVMGDKWIPRSSAQHPLGCKQKECPKMVKDFILRGGGAWNETKLSACLDV